MSGQPESPAGRHVVVLSVAEEKYAIDVQFVREIVRVPRPAGSPGCPGGSRSRTVALRGSTTPLIDLRTMFGLPEMVATPESRAIVVDVFGGHYGLIADAVTEVRRLPLATIGRPSGGAAPRVPGCVSAVAGLGLRPVRILDLELMVAGFEGAGASGLLAAAA